MKTRKQGTGRQEIVEYGPVFFILLFLYFERIY